MKKVFMSKEQIMDEYGYGVDEYNEIFGEDIVGCFVYEGEDTISLDLRNDGKFVYTEYRGREVFNNVEEFEESFLF